VVQNRTHKTVFNIYVKQQATFEWSNRSVVFSSYSVSSTNKTDRQDITEILLKVALSTINQTKPEQKCNVVISKSSFH
jgi:hypothetical protein